ncbi:g7278 [Coccomyxa viridis]|uniref:G7278 protein n=1 Tax=Coccomyxa viridis TaxID=1274662 RepID=A0ABP1G2B2_9CHLO
MDRNAQKAEIEKRHDEFRKRQTKIKALTEKYHEAVKGGDHNAITAFETPLMIQAAEEAAYYAGKLRDLTQLHKGLCYKNTGGMFPEAKELRNLEDQAGYFDEQRAKNFEIIAAGSEGPLEITSDPTEEEAWEILDHLNLDLLDEDLEIPCCRPEEVLEQLPEGVKAGPLKVNWGLDENPKFLLEMGQGYVIGAYVLRPESSVSSDGVMGIWPKAVVQALALNSTALANGAKWWIPLFAGDLNKNLVIHLDRLQPQLHAATQCLPEGLEVALRFMRQLLEIAEKEARRHMYSPPRELTRKAIGDPEGDVDRDH